MRWHRLLTEDGGGAHMLGQSLPKLSLSWANYHVPGGSGGTEEETVVCCAKEEGPGLGVPVASHLGPQPERHFRAAFGTALLPLGPQARS